MKYNEKYDLYLDDDLVIYYWNKRKDKMMQRKIILTNDGYLNVHTKLGLKRVHRVIYETFVEPIPDSYQIDHIDTHKDNNRLDNLRCVTNKENSNNPLTRKHMSEAQKGNQNAIGKPTSEFGRKFKEHYGLSHYQDAKLYSREYMWFKKHNKYRWEVK